MKKTLLLVLVAMLSLTVFSQKFKSKNEKFIYYTCIMPDIALKTSATYDLGVKCPPSLAQYLTIDLNEVLEVACRKRSNDNPDIGIAVTFSNFIISGATNKSRKVESKDKDGNVTGTTHYYWTEIKYKATAISQGIGPDDSKIGTFKYENPLPYKTEESESLKAISEFYNNNRTIVHEAAAQDFANKAVKYLNDKYAFYYGYRNKQVRSELFYIKAKKHAEMETFNANVNSAVASLKTITARRYPENIAANLADEIEYFENVLTKYTKDDKYEEKLRSMICHNLTTIYAALEQYDDAIRCADLSVQNGGKEKDAEKLKKSYRTIQKKMKEREMSTCHFL